MSITDPAVKFALAQVGDAYQFGGTGPDEWDCSGLVMVSLQQIGMSLPHNSGEQAKWFKQQGKLYPNRKYYRQKLLPGDVVFYYGSLADPESISHCGLYVGRGRLGAYFIVAAVDEQYGVKHHRMNWALAPIGFGYVLPRKGM